MRAERWRLLLLLCFFATGATGLVYEVVWARLLELYFGASQFAISTVLATFMAGLALGSAAGGRVADRLRRPLLAYAAAAIGVGLYCLATPGVFDAIGRLYLAGLGADDLHRASFQTRRFALAAAALLLPTFLMGTTLPVLVRHVVRDPRRIGADVGLLYGLNTLGAVAGCLVAGFVALPGLGIARTLQATGIADVALGLIVGLLALRAPAPSAEAPPASAPRRSGRRRRPARAEAATHAVDPSLLRALPAVLALSGFAALAYEVLWFRVLGLVLGASVYAFTVMLATFLTGLALGSALGSRRLPGVASPLRALAGLQATVAFSAALGVALYPLLPAAFLALFGRLSEQPGLFLAVQSGVCAAVMGLPTLAMGAVLPTAAHLYARSHATLGARVGDLYAWNTLGAIAGALVAGFALQPALGIQRSILLVATLNLAVAVALLLQRDRVSGRRAAVPALLGAASFAGLVALLPGWDARRMTIGPYVNHQEIRRYLAGYERGDPVDDLLYYREGVNAVISVRRARDGSWTSYQANGKWEGTVGEAAPNWSLLGHIPLLLADAPRSALLVGLGTGVTLGAMNQYPLERIDVVELEPAVVEAAAYFEEANRGALSDPRVAVHRVDGRTFLSAAGDRYDVIVSGVSDPWISGVSNLFTREYFQHVSRRLADGGVAAIWFQNYRISPDELRIALATLCAAFSEVSIWAPRDDPADLILVARKRPLRIDAERLHRRIQTEPDAEDLRAAGVASIFDFLNLLLLEDGDVRRWVRGAPLHTDDHPRLEFSLPLLLYTDAREGVVERAWEIVRQTRDLDPPVVVPEAIRASFYYALASTYSYYAYREHHAAALFRRVLELDPENEAARRYLEERGLLAREPGG